MTGSPWYAASIHEDRNRKVRRAGANIGIEDTGKTAPRVIDENVCLSHRIQPQGLQNQSTDSTHETDEPNNA
jgi:hypothetical protein